MRRSRSLLAVAVFVLAAFFAASGHWPWRRLEVAAPPPAAPAPTTSADTLQAGETLSEVLGRHGVDGLNLATLAGVLNPRQLRPGLVVKFRRPVADSEPDRIVVRTGPEQRVLFRRVADTWTAEAEPIHWRPETVRLEGRIDNSLYEALDAQVADSVLDGAERERLAWDLADVYAWQVDFTRDIQPGDRFEVLAERLVSEEGEVRFGRILASDLTIGGRHLTAFRFDAGGRGAFYDAKGNSLRRAFLRAPLEFRRISSVFSSARFHPILGLTRRHEGTDYAAPTGTPVMAAGDGVVIRAGWAGGYGNLVEIRHRNGIETRYGHLSRILTHTGARVTQGQVIGRVGATGLATGPHLHYEFRVNGVARDSRKVNLGGGEPIPRSELAAFQAERDSLSNLLYGPAPALIAQAAN